MGRHHDLRFRQGLDGFFNSRSGASAKLVSASASRTSLRLASNAVVTKLRVRCRRPRRVRSPMHSKRLSLSISPNSIGVSTARTITASSEEAFTASASRGEASVTRPAPVRSEPRAASRAAPVAARPPDTTTTWPRSILCPSIFGTGNVGCHSEGMSRTSSAEFRRAPFRRCRYRRRARGRNRSGPASANAPACAGRK